MVVVGGPVGNNQYVEDYLINDPKGPLGRATPVLDKLHKLRSVQEGMLILRCSQALRLAYALRVTPTSQTTKAAQAFNALLVAALARFTGIRMEKLRESWDPDREDGPSPLHQIPLPLDMAGFGLRDQRALAPLAYLGSLGLSLATISDHVP